LSLRSLAFILASAIRRARAVSSAALHRSPDRTSRGKMAAKMAAKMATKMAKFMPVPYEQFNTSQGDHGSGHKGPFATHWRG